MAFGFFNKIKEGLEKTRKSFVKNVETVIIGYAEIDDDFLDDLEAVMLTSDLGPKTTEYLMTEGVINNTGDVMPFMEDRITEMLVDQEDEITLHHPEVILVVGVNGVGKTTTIAKLANYYTKEGKKVIIAAGDTFRAAAADQLSIWADRVGVPIVKHKEGADPAAVVYDAMEAAKARNADNAREAAKARNADMVIVDTAGRLHTKVNLMEELKKMGRVANNHVEGAPHQTLLVLDGTTGQNAVSQAKLFGQAVPVNGIVVTKLDGTAKGGVVISIKEELGVPVRWIGVGEGMDDLRPFKVTNKYNREFLLEYVESENKKNECNVSLENMEKIVSLIEYFGIELYRPITRLLLSNWEEITERINNYTESDWMMADEIQKTTPTLDRFSIAMLIEVLEGEDTLNQAENAGRRLSEEELKAIRKHQDEQ